ncbi:MAG: precorrin-4 C(11)-methyltransferase [Nitrososphaeraceae archaeon]
MIKHNNTVYFVGSGPGDPELITLKAQRLLENADVIVYSGSLLNPKLLENARQDASVHDAASIDREEIFNILKDAAKSGKLAIRFHDGDPSLFSAIREQIDKLEEEGVNCKVIPGVTAVMGAAASLNLELTLPGITQTLIITRVASRTPVPQSERIVELAKHGATMALYLSVHLIEDVVHDLLLGGVYTSQTPAAVVYRATWDDEKKIVGTLDNIVRMVKEARITKTAVIIIGSVLDPGSYEFSKVYDPKFTHGYRRGR